MLKEVPQDLPPMNRAQRKAWDKLTKSAAFQKASPYRQAVELHRKGLGFMVPKDVYADVSIPNLAPIALLNDCRPYREGEVAHDLLRIRAAFDRLKDGSADKQDFDRVAVAFNLAKIRAIEIDEALADELESAQDAMIRCKERFKKHGHFGFDGCGLQACEYALEAHETILEASSHKQMQNAMEAARKAIKFQTKHGQQLAQLLE